MLFTQGNPIPGIVSSLRKFSIDSSAFGRPYFSLRFDEFLIYRCAKLRLSDPLLFNFVQRVVTRRVNILFIHQVARPILENSRLCFPQRRCGLQLVN